MEEKIDSNFHKGLRGIWRQLKPFKLKILLILILGLVSAAANGFVPYITGRFFDSLISLSRTENSDKISFWIILLSIWVIVQLIANNTDWIIDRMKRFYDLKIHLAIQATGFIHLLKLPITFHRNEHIQELMERLSQAGWRISSMFNNVIQIAPQILSVIIGLILAMTINVKLASILVIGVILYSILLLNILSKSAKIDEISHNLWDQSWNIGASAVNHIDTVKQSASENYEKKRIKETYKKTFDSWYKMEIIWSNIGVFQRIIVFLTQLAIFIFSVSFIKAGTISVGELIALNGYSLMFFGPFVTLGYSWQVFQNGLTSASNIEKIFEKSTEIYKPKNALTKEIEGQIEFKEVYFKYEDAQNTVLNNINFTANKGEVIALVGKSGAGKSTLISLIYAYFFPQKGQVLIDGQDTKNYDLTTLRRQIAVVPQEIALFNDTLESNIKYGSFDIKKDMVIKITKEVHLDKFVETLPDKYKTLVGERGVKLSVGQKQRVAIARAILRNPKILILDEPTSALDAETEKFVTESLSKLMTGRTTFIIAHRLSTVRKADRIIVLDKGKIIEQGSHNELLKIKNGFYKRLYNYQIGLH